MIPLHASAPVEELRIEPYWPPDSEMAQHADRCAREAANCRALYDRIYAGLPDRVLELLAVPR